MWHFSSKPRVVFWKQIVWRRYDFTLKSSRSFLWLSFEGLPQFLCSIPYCHNHFKLGHKVQVVFISKYLKFLWSSKKLLKHLKLTTETKRYSIKLAWFYKLSLYIFYLNFNYSFFLLVLILLTTKDLNFINLPFCLMSLPLNWE